jgi:hypothetical protein
VIWKIFQGLLLNILCKSLLGTLDFIRKILINIKKI